MRLLPPGAVPGRANSLGRPGGRRASEEVVPMKTPSCPCHPAGAIEALQLRFLTLLPRIELHGRISFRHVRCPIQREEVIAEMVALCWKWFLSLARRGKDATR